METRGEREIMENKMEEKILKKNQKLFGNGKIYLRELKKC